jgi:hypothetical protein
MHQSCNTYSIYLGKYCIYIYIYSVWCVADLPLLSKYSPWNYYYSTLELHLKYILMSPVQLDRFGAQPEPPGLGVSEHSREVSSRVS